MINYSFLSEQARCIIEKKRKTLQRTQSSPQLTSARQQPSKTSIGVGRAQSKKNLTPAYTTPAASTLVSKLASLNNEGELSRSNSFEISRSSSFTEQPRAWSSAISDLSRDDHLAVIENLEVGPIECSAPIDDPTFERLEPNSGIRLSCVLFRIFLILI
jgi:minichromosome maintenance protein 10